MRLFSSPIPHKVLAGAMTSLCIALLLGACSASMPGTQRPLSPSLSSELDAFLTSQAKSQQFRGAVLVARQGTPLEQGLRSCQHRCVPPQHPNHDVWPRIAHERIYRHGDPHPAGAGQTAHP